MVVNVHQTRTSVFFLLKNLNRGSLGGVSNRREHEECVRSKAAPAVGGLCPWNGNFPGRQRRLPRRNL